MPRAVECLTADAGYMRQYEDFQRLMVYGEKANYAACIETLRELSRQVAASLGKGLPGGSQFCLHLSNILRGLAPRSNGLHAREDGGLRGGIG